MIVALVGTAAAHPLGSGVSTETVVLRVGRDTVDVRYSAEVDTSLLVRQRSSRSPLEDLAVELQTGLALHLDGAFVALPPTTPTLDPDPSDHTVGVRLAFEVPRAGATSIHVATSNLEGARVLRATDVWVDPQLRVREASTLALVDGVVVRDDGLRWSAEADRREVSVVVDPEWRAWTWLVRGDDLQRAAAAVPPRGLGALAPAQRELVALVPWAVALLASKGAADPGWTGRLVGVAAGMLASALLPVGGVSEGVLAAVIGLAALSPWRASLMPLAAAGLLASVHPLRLAGLLALVVVLPAPRAATPRPGYALAAVAGWLLLRAVSGLTT